MSARIETSSSGANALRPEYEVTLAPLPDLPVARAVPAWRRVLQSSGFRRVAILVVLAVVWELFARWENNDLLVPTFTQTAQAFVSGIVSGELLAKVGISMTLLLQGYAGGVIAAFALSGLAMSTRIGRDLLDTLTAMLNPLPAIALLPLALLWFGLGQKSLIFVLIHSVLWPLALNIHSGFSGVPAVLRMTGRNYGLKGLAFVFRILVPAALPAILAGLRIAWAFAWRTLIASELVFGASSGQGGLGWYIFQNRNELMTDRVFAGLAMVIIIGLLVETLLFRTVERLTVRRWGMQH